MTDFSKLSHIVDNWVDPTKRTATAPKSLPKGGNILDDMDMRERVVDGKKAKTSLKVMILDDVQITKIMTASREEKRKILSRLTDSQRRRVLARFRELQKVKDDASVDTLNLVNLDSLLNNCIYSSDDYNINLLSQWESAYDVPAEIESFVEAVKSLDREAIKAELPAYKQFCDDKGIHTSIDLSSGMLSDENNPVSEDELTPTVDMPLGEGDSEGLEDEGEGFTIPEPNEVSDSISKAIKRVAMFDCLKYLASGGDDVWKVMDSSVSSLVYNTGCSYDDVSSIYSAAWSNQFTSYQQSIKDSNNELQGKLVARRVMDDIIDEIADKPLYDEYTGEEVVEDEDSKPMLQALSEALEAYVNGDTTLLDQIATTTMGGDSTEEPETEREADLMEENDELKDELEGEGDELPAEEGLPEEPTEEPSIPMGDSKSMELNSTELIDADDKDEKARKDEERYEKGLAKELAQLLKKISGKGKVEDGSDVEWNGTASVNNQTWKYSCKGKPVTDFKVMNPDGVVMWCSDLDPELASDIRDQVRENAIRGSKVKDDSEDNKDDKDFIDKAIDKVEEGVYLDDGPQAGALFQDEQHEVKDSVRLNEIIDKLQSKVPALQKYNFKVCDYSPVFNSFESPNNVVNPPLTRSEYYAMAPVCPDYFDLICATSPTQNCPNCTDYQVEQNGVLVNSKTLPQTYYAYGASPQEVGNMLGSAADPAARAAIINKYCCPMSDAFHLAALTNNLGFLDNTFYKKHLGDSEWVFDTVPECLKAYTDKPGSIRLVVKATDSSINLFGVNFEISSNE